MASASPARYPLIELAVGVAFAATALVLCDDGAELALGLVFVAVLAAVTLTDLERRVIPNAILLAGGLTCVAIVVATDPGSLPERFAAAAGGGGFLLLAALVYPARHGDGRREAGGGDGPLPGAPRSFRRCSSALRSAASPGSA